jgi:hypothetical protein
MAREQTWTVVVAGTYEQFQTYCRARGIGPYGPAVVGKKVMYYSGPDRLKGLDPRTTEIVFIGTYNSRRDIHYVYERIPKANLRWEDIFPA